MSISRPSPRLRRLAASTGALALAGTLALSGVIGPNTEMTEAAWNDTEVAQASVKAEWASGGWAQTVTNAYSNHGSYPGWAYADRTSPRQDLRDSVLSPGAFTDSRGNLTSSPLSTNFRSDTPYPRPGTNSTFCVQAAAPLAQTGTHSGCTSAGPAYTLNSQTRAKVWGRSGGAADPINGISQPLVWVEANNVATMAECAADGSSYALPPTASLANWGSANRVGFISTFSTTISGITSSGYTDGWYKTLTPQLNKTVIAWILPNYAPGASYSQGDVYIRVSLTSRAYMTAGYALSDLYVTIDQFRDNSEKTYLGSFSVIFGRAECAVTTPTRIRVPLSPEFEPLPLPPPAYPANPGLIPVSAVPAPLPRPDGTLAYPGDLDYPTTTTSNQFFTEQASARGTQERIAPTSELSPTTTLTSPLENSTASETTTSAPPNSSGEDESTTAGTSTAATTSTTRSTTTVISAVPTVSAAPTNTTTPPATKTATTPSAAPAVVIPDDPGTLSPTARLEDVGTVTVGGEDFVVVTPGDTVPTDAPQGVAALEIWLGGGDPGDTWATFTSTDPAADGWRWAAINQETGTVVYVR